MKKHALLFAAFLAVTSFTSCLKDTTRQDAEQSGSEVKITRDAAIDERGACPAVVTISGGFGVTVCGNLNANPNGQYNCANCESEYGAFVIDSNSPVTLTMKTTCFTIWNTSGSSRNITFQVQGYGTGCNNTYSFAVNGIRNFCIARTNNGTCCRVIETNCNG